VIESLLRSMPYLIPYLILYLTAVVMAMRLFKRAPMPAWLALSGFGLKAILLVAQQLSSSYFMSLAVKEATDWLPMHGVVSATLTVLDIIAMSLVVIAVFSARERGDSKEPIQGRPVVSSQVRPHRAIAVLVLGIISVILFPPLGLAAWLLGRSDIAAMRNGEMDRGGEGMTGVGQALGIVGTVLFFVGLLALVAWGIAAPFV